MSNGGKKIPHVFFQRTGEGKDAFEIVHERYRSFVRDQSKQKPGYIATEIVHLLDEATTRRELIDTFGATEQEATDVIARARRFAGEAK